MADQFAIIVSSPQPGQTTRLIVLPLFLRCRFAPLKIASLGSISSPFGRVSGHLISLNLDSNRLQKTSNRHLLKGVLRAGRKAARLGARIVGLDPLLGIALGDSAVAVARTLGLTVTGGFGCTAAAAIDGLQKAAALVGLSLEDAAVLVLGAAEPLGFVCTLLLAHDGVNYLTLVDRDHNRLDFLSRRVLYDYGVACKTSTDERRAVGQADLVVAAAPVAGPVLALHDLKPGAVVCNVSAGEGLSSSIAMERPDVIVFDGAAVQLPGETARDCDLGLPRGCVHAWMAETILWALEGRYDRYFLGRQMRVEKVSEMRRLALKHGFTLSGFTVANRYLSFAEVKSRGTIPGRDNITAR